TPFQILSVVFLGVFLAPVLTNGNVGQTSHQTVNIDHKRKVVNIDYNNGRNSWSFVMDYGTGFMATRILSKKVCFITRMNKQIVPEITTLPKTIRQKQVKIGRSGRKVVHLGPAEGYHEAPRTPSTGPSLDACQQHSIHPNALSLRTFCRGIPSYLASEVKSKSWLWASLNKPRSIGSLCRPASNV
uniref:BRICHOS domain-containing protein n=1 Tax=Laticauda laticaudata TaxID=8630 RepID=A0A8C5SNM6_LATLA